MSERQMIYGSVIRISLEELTLLQLRFMAEVTKETLQRQGVTPGRVQTRCEPSRWLELDGQEFFMPAEVLVFREGFKDG